MTTTPGTTHGRRIVWVSATLLSASFVGRLPQAMGALAIVWLVLSAGGDYGYASALTALYVVAGTIGQPLWGRIVDRTGAPVPVIAGTAVVAGGALCVLATSPGLLLVAGTAVIVAGLATPPIEPVLRSLWPRLVPAGPQLTRAFAADAAVQEVLFIAGPLVAALAVGWGGPAVAVVAMAVLGVLGAAAFVAQRPLRLFQGERGVDRPAAGAARTGTVLRNGALRRIISALILAGLSIGVLTISATTFAGVHGAAGGVGAGGSSMAGVALAANAAGALLGAVLVARFPPKVEARRLLSPLLIVLGVLYLPTAAFGLDPILWLVFAALSGVALPPLLTQVFVLTERVAPPEQLVEANAWVVSAFNIGIAAGTLGAGVLVEAFSGQTGGSSELGSVVAVLAAGACAVVAATMVRSRAFPA